MKTGKRLFSPNIPFVEPIYYRIHYLYSVPYSVVNAGSIFQI